MTMYSEPGAMVRDFFLGWFKVLSLNDYVEAKKYRWLTVILSQISGRGNNLDFSLVCRQP